MKRINKKKLNALKKTLSLLTCCTLSVSVVAEYGSFGGNRKAAEVSARTLNEIQAEREANEQKIAELENQIAALQGSENDQKAYQEKLLDQIALIKDNINLLTNEMNALAADIQATEENIKNLDQNIADQEKEIETKVELFKQRLNEMYISGNENAASLVIGSTSFYDVMSRLEMANRMAEYDEKLVNELLGDIEQLEKDKDELETEKLTLEMKRESQEKRREEKESALSELDEKMQYTQSEIDRLENERLKAEMNKDEYEKIVNSLNAEEEVIRDAIRKAEEEQRRKEEEERRRQEQLALQQQQQQSGNSGSSAGTPTVQQPTYTPPVQSSGNFIWPAPGFSYISSYYGTRWVSQFHKGIDIGDAGIHGGAAVASQSGTVVAVYSTCIHDRPKNKYGCGCGGNYGNYVLISHDSTYSTMYAHLASVNVSVGDYVSQGQVVGYIGCTGFSTGDHLHFEVRVNGVQKDPMLYVSR